MISNELQQIVDKFKEQGKMAFLEAATLEKIDIFEKENDITLPIKYKEWLLFSDGGEFFLPAGIQLYGVEHKPVINVPNAEVSSFMVYAMMNVDDSGYYSFQEVNTSKYFFPFGYQITKETILQDDRFMMSNLGGELSVALNG